MSRNKKQQGLSLATAPPLLDFKAVFNGPSITNGKDRQ